MLAQALGQTQWCDRGAFQIERTPHLSVSQALQQHASVALSAGLFSREQAMNQAQQEWWTFGELVSGNRRCRWPDKRGASVDGIDPARTSDLTSRYGA